MRKKEVKNILFEVFIISITLVVFILLTKSYIGLVVYDNSFLKLISENDTTSEYELPHEVFVENLKFYPEDTRVVYLDKNVNGLIDHLYIDKDAIFKLKIEFNKNQKVNITIKLNLSDEELIKKYNLKEDENIFSIEITNGEIKELSDKVEKISLDREFKINLQDAIPLLNINDTHYSNITGSNKTICIIDTGISNHSSLINRVINQKCYCVGCCPNGLNEDENAFDDNGHGTMVAGIAGASGGVIGTAPGSNFVIVKVCSSGGSCKSSDVIKAINYCTENKEIYNISAMSMSLGSPDVFNDIITCNNFDQILMNAVDSANEKGIFISISSGNGYSRSGVSYPSCLENATSVGATNKNDQIESYSNLGDLLDILAPGTNINTTTCTGPYSLCGSSGYTNLYSGTSFSAPFIAGASALIDSYNDSLSPTEKRDLFISTGKKILYNGKNYSRINVFAAIQNISINITENKRIVWHDLEKDLPFGFAIKEYNNLTFYANFSNDTSCNFTIKNQTYNMTYNENKTLFEFTKDFFEFRDYQFFVDCGNETINSSIKKEEFNFYINKSLRLFLNENQNKTIEGLSLFIYEFNNTNISYKGIINSNMTDIINLTKFSIINGEPQNKTPHRIFINYSNLIIERSITIENDSIEESNETLFNFDLPEIIEPQPAPSGGSSGSSGGSSSHSSISKKTEDAQPAEKTIEKSEPSVEEKQIEEKQFNINENDNTRILEEKTDTKKENIYLIGFISALTILAIVYIIIKTNKEKFIKKNRLRNKKR